MSVYYDGTVIMMHWSRWSLMAYYSGSKHNGHIYYVVLNEGANRQHILEQFSSQGVGAVFYYVPLHSCQ